MLETASQIMALRPLGAGLGEGETVSGSQQERQRLHGTIIPAVKNSLEAFD